MTDKQRCRGAHQSVPALENDIRDWINDWNDDPKPFAWTKTADDILERLASYLHRIPGAGHSEAAPLTAEARGLVWWFGGGQSVEMAATVTVNDVCPEFRGTSVAVR